MKFTACSAKETTCTTVLHSIQKKKKKNLFRVLKYLYILKQTEKGSGCIW